MNKQQSKGLHFSERFIARLGRFASVLSVLMYVSYIPQIMNNLEGNKGNFIQPAVAAVNCICWVIYAYFKEDRDIPVLIANIPGVIFGIIAALTALL
ncbi:SemiSWEET family transporter [Lancefieldella sp. Marseille-Q7238]|uniref:SemiSWEET family transporter n=1 Tax=Lancefieldella sp. Marseille-Q7238 TaxID=3022127 RepID=UPI0024A8E980|nr:SemiSWEET family transporter [Lancefieldella sp. Marseille-Q7238]